MTSYGPSNTLAPQPTNTPMDRPSEVNPRNIDNIPSYQTSSGPNERVNFKSYPLV